MFQLFLNLNPNNPNGLIKNIFQTIGMEYRPQDDEWEWEKYLDEVNESLQTSLELFHEACIISGIPRMHVNIFCDGKKLFVHLRMSIIRYPSDINTGALFDWLRDFVLGVFLSPRTEGGPTRISLKDRYLTTLEVGMIADMLETLNKRNYEALYEIEGVHR